MLPIKPLQLPLFTQTDESVGLQELESPLLFSQQDTDVLKITQTHKEHRSKKTIIAQKTSQPEVIQKLGIFSMSTPEIIYVYEQRKQKSYTAYTNGLMKYCLNNDQLNRHQRKRIKEKLSKLERTTTIPYQRQNYVLKELTSEQQQTYEYKSRTPMEMSPPNNQPQIITRWQSALTQGESDSKKQQPLIVEAFKAIGKYTSRYVGLTDLIPWTTMLYDLKFSLVEASLKQQQESILIQKQKRAQQAQQHERKKSVLTNEFFAQIMELDKTPKSDMVTHKVQISTYESLKGIDLLYQSDLKFDAGSRAQQFRGRNESILRTQPKTYEPYIASKTNSPNSQFKENIKADINRFTQLFRAEQSQQNLPQIKPKQPQSSIQRKLKFEPMNKQVFIVTGGHEQPNQPISSDQTRFSKLPALKESKRRPDLKEYLDRQINIEQTVQRNASQLSDLQYVYRVSGDSKFSCLDQFISLQQRLNSPKPISSFTKRKPSSQLEQLMILHRNSEIN